MDVILSNLRGDAQECEVLVSGFFEDERPLRGASGWLDWRLNGLLSCCLIENRLVGTWKETTLIPSQGRIVPSFILLVGLGKLREYSYPRLRDLCPFLLETLGRLRVSKVCFCLPEDERHQVEPAKLAEILMEGIADTAETLPFPGGREWVKGLQPVFAREEGDLSEILLGLQTAQSILRDRINIRILTVSEKGNAPSMTQRDVKAN
jgi:hypothetical protein